MKEDKDRIFCTCDSDIHDQGSFNCADPEMILVALHDAKEAMNYSNWHNDKFDRLIELVVHYCNEKGIPKRFI